MQDDEITKDDFREDGDEEEEGTPPARPGSQLAVLLIGVLIILMVIAGVRGIVLYQEHQQHREAAKIGDVSITPEMTLADYRRSLGQEESADTASDSGIQVANACDFHFAGNLVIATFLAKDPATVTPIQAPIYVAIDRTFRGRVCGVRPTDTLAEAIAAVRQSYPGALQSDDFDTRHEIMLGNGWSIAFPSVGNGPNDPVGDIVLRDKAWATVPSSEPS